MKLLTLLVFILLASSCIAQVKNGIYKSGKLSFRENYYLQVNETNVTLFGWEIDTKGDTIYFRSSTIFTGNPIQFDIFDFSRNPITESNLMNFTPSYIKSIDTFLVYRYLTVRDVSDQIVSIFADKDMYDNLSDYFQFELIN